MSLFDINPKLDNPKKSLLEGFDNFVTRNVTNLFNRLQTGAEEFFRPTPNVRPRDILREIGGLAKGAIEAFKTPEDPEEARRRGLIPIIDPKTGKAILSLDPIGASGIKIVGKGAVKGAVGFLKPAITRVTEEAKPGKTLARLITEAADIGEVQAGKRIDDLLQSGLTKLNRNNRFNLLDVFEGIAAPINRKINNTFRSLKPILDDIADEAIRIGVRVKEKVGGKVVKRAFQPRQNFFPRMFPSSEQLAKGQIRKDVAENIVRRGFRTTITKAESFIDDFRGFLDSGKRTNSLINHMVETGQAKNTSEAFATLQRFRSRTIKTQGSIEFARQADLPFFDPDPARVLPKYFSSTSQRLAQIQSFGQNNETINKLINQIRNAGGDADLVRTAVDRILNISNSGGAAEKASSLIRTLQGFKLGLAAIPNVTQGTLNTLLAGDLKAVVAGVGGLLSQQGRRFGTRSGATLQSVINETLEQAGAKKGPLSTFLKATGFTVTEKMNRIIAANGGKSYATRLLNNVIRNSDDIASRSFLRELGVNVEKAVGRGSLLDDEVLLAAKKFSDMTQFRSRPQDLPLFASTPAGKVFFQFKNFIYGQTRLLYRVTVQEFKNKNFARGVRNLLILGSVFPLTGEAIANIRGLITGRERKEKGLERYFDNIAQVGALGIFMETIQAGQFGKGTEFLAGPAVSDIGEIINILGRPNTPKNLSKFLFSRVPLIGQLLKRRVSPSEAEQKEQRLEAVGANPFDF